MLQLDAGYRIVMAPRFPAPATWSGRVRLGSGVNEDGGRFFPRPDWRTPLEAEEALKFDRSPGDAFPLHDLGLFAITDRLRARWWTLAEAGVGSSGAGGDWFASYASEVTEFLRFKGLPLPPSCSFEATVSQPGRPSTRVDARPDVPRLTGLALNQTPATGPREFGGLNLGDEPTALVFVNLSPSRMADRLDAAGHPRPSLDAPDEVARQFLARLSDYPLVRLTLGPGEGFRLPSEGTVFDGDTVDQAGLQVTLVLRSHE